jgi:hypothetical protein
MFSKPCHTGESRYPSLTWVRAFAGDDKKNATSRPDREFQNPRSWKLCGAALQALIEGGFLRLDDDRLAATASG